MRWGGIGLVEGAGSGGGEGVFVVGRHDSCSTWVSAYGFAWKLGQLPAMLRRRSNGLSLEMRGEGMNVGFGCQIASRI